MKPRGPEFLTSVVSTLQSYLADVPFCTFELQEQEPATCDYGADIKARLHLPEGDRLLVIQAKQTGQPRTARESANELRRCIERFPNAVPVFAAPYISPAAAEILMRDGIGYVDLSGNCRIVFGRVYIRREYWPNKFTARRDLQSLYSPKAERVLRVLLQDVRHTWKIVPLAKAAGISLGQASNVKRLLEDREWLGRGENGAALARPAELLAEWAQNYRSRRNKVRDFYSSDTPAQIEAKLAMVCRQAGAEYALAGFSAAIRLAPMVRYQRAMAYVAGDSEILAGRLALKPVSSGANVSLIEPYDAGVFIGRREVDGVAVTSAVQTYLDLLSFKSRGEEAAQAVLEQAIRPQW